MCPHNFTNFEDGSSECSIPMTPGTNLRMRYAVIVSFGVFLNGTSLDSIADKVSLAGASASICRSRQSHCMLFSHTQHDCVIIEIKAAL